MTILLKRTIGISVIGWMMIILASFQLAFSFNPQEIAERYSTFPAPWAKTFYFVGIALLFAEIVIGINVLSLKEWARKGVYVLVCFYLVIILSAELRIDKYYSQYLQNSFQQSEQIQRKLKFRLSHMKERYLETTVSIEGNQKNLKLKFAWYPFLADFILIIRIFVLAIKFILWYIIAVIFFARPKVRVQFQ